MTKKRWTVEDKAKIVIESLTTTTSAADICKKYGLSPNTFYPWREKFLEGGRARRPRVPVDGAVSAIPGRTLLFSVTYMRPPEPLPETAPDRCLLSIYEIKPYATTSWAMRIRPVRHGPTTRARRG